MPAPSGHPGARPSSRSAPTESRTGAPASPHVLVAEDEVHVARMLATLLEDAGMRVTVVADGRAALDTIGEDRSITLVILDLMMPGMGGLEVLRELRRRGGEGRLPVIVLTGKGETGVRQEALDCGATELFIKPFSPRKLVDRVAELGRR